MDEAGLVERLRWFFSSIDPKVSLEMHCCSASFEALCDEPLLE